MRQSNLTIEGPISPPRELVDWARHCRDRLGAPGARLRIGRDDRLGAPLATATPGAIRLNATVFDAASHGQGEWRAVVAHEIAHLRQFELGARLSEHASLDDLEREADDAAEAILAGGRFSCRRGAPPTARLNWNRLGHYYTVLCLALHAGWPYTLADQAAYMAQVPDLALELDAPTMSVTGLALYIFGDVADRTQREIYTRTFIASLVDLHTGQGTKANMVIPHNFVDASCVSIGLHSLSGCGIGDERQYRLDNLKSYHPKDYRFGLALHAFGDSYAHCRQEGGKMFTPILGHAYELHVPDCTSQSIRNYLPYIRALWDVMWDKGSFIDMAPTTRGFGVKYPRDLRNKTQAYKDQMYSIIARRLGDTAKIMDDEKEAKQIGPIRDFINYMWPGTAMALPDADSVPFAALNNTGLVTGLGNCLTTAKQWASERPGAVALASKEFTLKPVKNEIGRFIGNRINYIPGAQYVANYLKS